MGKGRVGEEYRQLAQAIPMKRCQRYNSHIRLTKVRERYWSIKTFNGRKLGSAVATTRGSGLITSQDLEGDILCILLSLNKAVVFGSNRGYPCLTPLVNDHDKDEE